MGFEVEHRSPAFGMAAEDHSPVARTAPARRLWQLFEAVHAVAYFAPEAIEAMAVPGYRGFFMGYFAARAAPMGPVAPEVVTAASLAFPPDQVARALPEAWAIAGPEAALAARRAGVAAALGRIWGHPLPPAFTAAVAEAGAAARAAVEAAVDDVGGRPFFAAHLVQPWPASPVLDLWHACTVLREHRGDGHVAVLTAEGVGGAESHWLQVATGASTESSLRQTRRWSDDEWAAAGERLRQRGWLDVGGTLTPTGREAKGAIEARTDDLAGRPWARAGGDAAARFTRAAAPLVAAVAASRLIPAGNPIGLPVPDVAPAG